jgi:hypothetical protein
MRLLFTDDVVRPLDRGIMRQGVEQDFPIGRSNICEIAGHAGDLGIGEAFEQGKSGSRLLGQILLDDRSHPCAKASRHLPSPSRRATLAASVVGIAGKEQLRRLVILIDNDVYALAAFQLIEQLIAVF